MNNKYWNKTKKSLFPEIDDWTLDYNQYRLAKNAGKLPLKYYLFFTPASYLIASLGTNVMTFLIFGGLAWWLFYKKIYILALLGTFIALQGLLALIKNIRQWEYIKRTTFYDVWFRET